MEVKINQKLTELWWEDAVHTSIETVLGVVLAGSITDVVILVLCETKQINQ